MPNEYKQQANAKFWTGKTILASALLGPAGMGMAYGYKASKQSKKPSRGKTALAAGAGFLGAGAVFNAAQHVGAAVAGNRFNRIAKMPKHVGTMSAPAVDIARSLAKASGSWAGAGIATVGTGVAATMAWKRRQRRLRAQA